MSVTQFSSVINFLPAPVTQNPSCWAREGLGWEVSPEVALAGVAESPCPGVHSGNRAPEANKASICRPVNTPGPQPATQSPVWPCPETLKTLSASAHEMPRVKQSFIYKQNRGGGGPLRAFRFPLGLNFVRCAPTPLIRLLLRFRFLTDLTHVCWERSPSKWQWGLRTFQG